MRKTVMLLLVIIGCSSLGFAQTTVTGSVTDKKGEPQSGVSVSVQGTKNATATNNKGSYTLNNVAADATLVFSGAGVTRLEEKLNGRTVANAEVETNASNLSEVVVIGYGTTKKKDLTGAVTSVQAKDFNKGTYTSADQLIQGKVAGVQMLNNSGQPGGAATVKIRGSSSISGAGQPLYVVDGVQLDNRSPRPGIGDLGLGGGNPGSNPLNFINPSDIASIDVLKDASATAIYGSRAAYGVVLITTKKGKAGQTKIDFSASTGAAKIAKRIKVLTGAEYVQALSYYGLPNTVSTTATPTNNKGDNVNALDAILRTAQVQNYSVGISGGGENGRFRLSLGSLKQDGIIKKSGIEKYTANFSANLRFLESKKFGLDINIIPSQYIEDIAPITNDAGAAGSLIGQALQWNPTKALKIGDSIVNIGGNSVYNPLGVSEAFNDRSKVTTILASIAPSYKFTDWLEYKFQYSINYASGNRRTSRNSNINVDARFNGFTGVGFAAIGNNELITSQLTHTLNFDKKIAKDLNLNAVVGFEYQKLQNKGNAESSEGPNVFGGFGQYGLDYTDYIQFGNPANRSVSSFADPIVELQSYFARTAFNYKDKYLVTATLRRDGSSKFGTNNKYGNFPSFGAGWNISKEDFFKVAFINSLKVRGGWGKTGNQEFPAGVAADRYQLQTNGQTTLINNRNPDLKWQSDRQYNVGFDATFLKNKISLTVDYFNKLTTGLLYPTVPAAPAQGGAPTWKNIDGKIENKGIEFAINANIIDKKDFSFDLGINASFIKNNVSELKTSIPTGALNGQGITGTTVEVIQNGLPLNAFFTREFTGLDANGIAAYTDKGNTNVFIGSPNPKTVMGISTTIRYKMLSLTANLNGAFGQKIYNNTLNNVINVGSIQGGKNIAKSVFTNPVKESFANPVTASSRFIENGSYMKLANATLSYSIGTIAKVIKGSNVFITGQNLLTFTKFTGFDPEVNVDKNVNGVPSAGIEYTPYPSARTITFGINFSL